MPAFSFHRPRFLRSRRSRSRSPKPSPPDPHDDAVISHSTAFSSRPSSTLGIPGKDMNATATGASHLSVPGDPVDHQKTTDLLVGDSSNASAQPSQVSRPVIPSGFVPSNATRTPELHDSDSVQAQKLLAPPFPSVTPSQQALTFDPLILQHPTMFNQARNFTVTGGNFFAGNVTNNNLTSNQFMKDLLKETIPGAEFDSSARDPPPRCHPGTRLAILDRCLYFIHNCGGMRKMRWVVGAAGVGKSALLQSVVESPKLVVSCHASVFFSINGREDGTKAVITISYQLAAKSKPYRQLIETEITDDPSLLRSSLAKQFLKLIIEPFVHNTQLRSTDRVLIVVDGLDECKNPRTQLELLRLIFDLCIKYPSSPLVWLIASRPEQHITSFFSRIDVAPAYEKEEIAVDTDEAREDVERYLRAKLAEIKKKASDSVNPRWPEEQDFWKLANAAGGLFAYADTAVRYIDDTTVGSPASQLSDVLNVIDNHPMTDVPQADHPMALLDALYTRILSNVPSKVMRNTRKLLLVLAAEWVLSAPKNFIKLCNWLGMTPDEAYAAINHLRSVLHVPTRREAHEENLTVFHKSFMDYIADFRRSGFSHDIKREAQQVMAQCASRIINEAPHGVDFGDIHNRIMYGTLRRGPDAPGKISLTWPVGEEASLDDNAMRFGVYKLAVLEVGAGMERAREDPTFPREFCLHIISTLFATYNHLSWNFSFLRDLVLDESRRQEFVMNGIIKQMPLKAVGISPSSHEGVKLQFHRSATAATDLSDTWNSSCTHNRAGKWGKGDDQDWETEFWLRWCDFCTERLEHQLNDWRTRSPDHVVPIWFTSTGYCCVEVRFVDPDDGVSEWTYQTWVELSLEERKKYGSDV